MSADTHDTVVDDARLGRVVQQSRGSTRPLCRPFCKMFTGQIKRERKEREERLAPELEDRLIVGEGVLPEAGELAGAEGKLVRPEVAADEASGVGRRGDERARLLEAEVKSLVPARWIGRFSDRRGSLSRRLRTGRPDWPGCESHVVGKLISCLSLRQQPATSGLTRHSPTSGPCSPCRRST